MTTKNKKSVTLVCENCTINHLCHDDKKGNSGYKCSDHRLKKEKKQ